MIPAWLQSQPMAGSKWPSTSDLVMVPGSVNMVWIRQQVHESLSPEESVDSDGGVQTSVRQ